MLSSCKIESVQNFLIKLDMKPCTVFPRIVSAETILFLKLECGKYSREETNQGRKLLILRGFDNGNYSFLKVENVEIVL